MRLRATEIRIAEIKRVWKDGMSAGAIASAVDTGIWGKRPTRESIVGMFHRWSAELAPCRLMPVVRLPVPEKPKTKKNTRLVELGFTAIGPKSKIPMDIRADYELTEKALQKHRHEERMLERDRANLRSPAVRAGEGTSHHPGIIRVPKRIV